MQIRLTTTKARDRLCDWTISAKDIHAGIMNPSCSKNDWGVAKLKNTESECGSNQNS